MKRAEEFHLVMMVLSQIQETLMVLLLCFLLLSKPHFHSTVL